MAITDAQQAKQIMMKKGGPVTQAGVKNYKPSKMVTVPKIAKSSPTHPTAKLAYITDAEKKLLIKKNLHGSLKGKPNRGPGGIPSLQGDFGPGGRGSYSEAGTGRDVGRDDQGRTTIGGDINQGRDVAADRRERAAQINRSREAAARREAAKKAEKERQAKETEKKVQETKKAKTKKIKKFTDLADLEVIPGLFEDDEEDVAFDVFDTNKDGKIGILEGLNKKRTELAKKTLTNSAAQKLGMMQKSYVPSFFMSDMMRTTPPGVTTEGLDEILGVEGRDKTTGVGSMTDPFEVDYSMTQYGLDGKDLTRARDQIDVAMQDRISQEDFDRVYGNNPPPRDDDRGPQLPILPIQPIQPVEDKKEDEEDPFQLALAFRKDGGRVGLMEGGMPYEGGIMDLESGRQMYFLGKLVKKATRAVKKIVKSPIGKIGLGALAFKFGAPLLQGSSFMKNFGFNAIKDKIAGAGIGKLAGLSIGGGLLAGALAGKGYEDEDGDGFDDNTGFSVEEYRKRGAEGKGPIAFRAEGGMSDVESDPQYKGWKRIYEVNPDAAEMHPKHREFVKYYASVERQGKEEGGLMNLKGMEMDFREEGGFVPIGKKERADDVPARLSKNEFVMTADAVRGAGDGNIDKGAEKMYNLMSKLEAENDQPQGLDGARKMFQTSQRLEEVL